MNIKQKISIWMAMFAVLTPVVVAAPLYAAECGGTKTSIISCPQDNSSKDVKDSGIWGVLLILINILTAGIGVAAVGGLLMAGITYATASNDQNKIVKAKEMIYNVVLGLVLYAAMWAFMQFLIPGGIFA